MCANSRKETMTNVSKPSECVKDTRIHVLRSFFGPLLMNGNWNAFPTLIAGEWILGHHEANVVITYPKVVIHVMHALDVSCLFTMEDEGSSRCLVLYGLASICTRNWYEDWACVECCQGDRCNRYVVVCEEAWFFLEPVFTHFQLTSNHLRSSSALMLIGMVITWHSRASILWSSSDAIVNILFSYIHFEINHVE